MDEDFLKSLFLQGVEDKELQSLRYKLSTLFHSTLPKALSGEDITDQLQEAEAIEFDLQEMQGYPLLKERHLFPKWIEFSKHWVGRTFRCKETQETFTIPIDVQPKMFYSVGNGYVDVGCLHLSYARFSNVEEITPNGVEEKEDV